MITTTKNIVLNVASDECPERTIRDRIPVLRDRNLLEKPTDLPEGVSEKGVYQISDLGRRIVEGDMSLSELRELENEGAFE